MLNKSGLGPVLHSFAADRDLFRHSDHVRVRPACLDGDLITHSVLLHVLCLLLTRLPNQDWTSFDTAPAVSLTDRILLLHNLSTFTPSIARLQYWESSRRWPVFHSPSASWRMCGPGSCDASLLRSCQTQTALLINSFAQNCTEQSAHARSENKLRTFLSDKPQNFMLIFWIAEVLPFFLAARVEAQGCHRSPFASLWSLSTKNFLNLVLPVHS